MAMKLSIVSLFDPRGVNQATSGMDRLGKFAAGFGVAAGAAFAAAAAGAVAFGISSIKAAAESESVARSLEQLAKNSGAFGDTADEVKGAVKEITAFTTSLSKLTGVDDEVLNSVIRGFIAIPELAAKGVDGLKNMAKVALDVAAGTGKGVEAIGSAFIKVAGDESTALSKLLRAGIVFTESQKAAYNQILETNGEIAAQDYLLGQLGTTFKGAAEAAANPFLRLQAILEDFQENLGNAFLPAIEDAIPIIQAAVDSFVASPDFADFIDDASAGFAEMLEFLPEVLATMTKLGKDAIPVLNDLLPAFNTLVGLASGKMGDLADSSDNAFGILADVAGVLGFVVGLFEKVDVSLKQSGDSFNLFGAIIKGVLDAATATFSPFLAIFSRLNDLIQAVSGAEKRQRISGFANPAFANIPRMAAGGIVMPSPGGSLVNVAEAGRAEAIIPLDRLGKMGGGTTNNYSVNVQAGVGDPQAIGQQIVAYIKRYEKASGPVFAGA